MFPTIFVITVKTFYDRIAHMQEQEKRLGLSFEYLWPFDAAELTEEDKAGIELPKNTSISSARKHLLAQYRLVDSGSDYAVVLEDDAILDANFAQRLIDLLGELDKLSGPWIVNLAGADSKIDDRFLFASENQLIERRIATVEGYVINRAGALLRIAEFEQRGMKVAFDHWLQQVDDALNIPHFWVAKPMLRQGSVTGEFSTVLDASRSKKPSWFLSLKFRWNVLRRQTLPRLLARFRYRWRD